MKVNFFLIAILLVSCRGSQDNDKNTIIESLYKQQEHWNNADIDAFMTYYWKSDSLRFIGKSGIKYGWQNTLNNYKKSYPDVDAMGKLKFEIEDIRIYENEAYVLGRWSLSREAGNLGGYFSLIWKKIDGKWLIISDHTS